MAPRWKPARIRHALRRRLSKEYLRRRWRLGFVKTRFGLELVRNLIIDLRYGGRCDGADPTAFPGLGAYGTSSIDYWQLRRIFCGANGLEARPGDVLVDVGCGKGRVLNHWLRLGRAERIVGIELDPRWAEPAARRLAAFPKAEVICGDALESIPPDANLFFLFNPFGPAVLERFKDRVAELFDASDGIVIVYYFCLHVDVFERDPRWIVEPLAIKTFHPGVVIRMRETPPRLVRAPSARRPTTEA